MKDMNPQEILDNSSSLISAGEVQQAVERLANALNERFAGTQPLFLSVMNGAMIPGAWLVTKLKFPLQMDYVHATRYQSTTHGGIIDFRAKPSKSVEGRTVILFDDIYDEGYTLEAIRDWCIGQGARKVISVALVRKLHDRGLARDWLDYFGLDVPDVYIFGCGMDAFEYHRELDHIRVLEI